MEFQAETGPRFTLAGFADEAGDSIEEQIGVTRELGWEWIEARSIDGCNIHDLDEPRFAAVARALEKASVRVCCFGSTIANWGQPADSDLGQTLKTLRRAIARMKALDVKLIRIMSYSIITDEQGKPVPDQRWEMRIEKLRILCSEICEAGLIPIHENCFNYGGMSTRHTRELLEAIPGLRLVFDTGNPCLTPDFSRPFPWPNQDSWESWNELKEQVVHLHVKDGWRDPVTGEEHYVFPGEGPAHVREILGDCSNMGYRGFLSIEPHMAVVYHDARVRASREQRRQVYLEFGRRLEAMLRSLGFEVKKGQAVRGGGA